MDMRVVRSKIAWMALSFTLLASLGLAAAPPTNASDMQTVAVLDSQNLQSPVPGSHLTKGIPYRETEALAGKARVLVVHTITSPPLITELTDLAATYPNDIALLDLFDTTSGTSAVPTLSQLSAYDVVIVATNSPLQDGVLLGDRLADYMDMGGRVIVTMSSWIPGWSLGGRFASGGYFPFVVADTRNSGPFSLGSFDGDHPIMNGVTALGGLFRSSPAVVDGTYVVARWNDDKPLIAVKGSVVGINALPAVSYISGDVGLLFHNAVTYLMTARIRVLVAPADDYPTKLVGELVKDSQMGAVDFLRADQTTPALSQLARYDVVITWPNYPYASATAMGDVLADYADIGGKVVLGGFCWYTGGNDLKGRIMTGGYSPLDATGGGDHVSPANLGYFDGTNPIMWDVTAASTYYRDFTALASGANLVALWDDGENCVADKDNVVALNGYLGEVGSSFTGDLGLMARNAAKFLVLVNNRPSASSYAGSAPMTVTFTGSATGGQQPYTYLWQFGDGTSSTAQNPSYTFTAAGNFLVEFYTTDSAGHSSAFGFYISVTAPLTLTAAAAPASGVAPLTVGFAASPSGGTPPYTYDWNYGDGSAHGTSQNPSHTYAAGGYVATLAVTDAASHTAVKTFPISSGPALTVSASATPTSGTAPLAVGFVCLASGGTAPYAYAWTFGDGGTGTGSTSSHTYSNAGAFTATVTVTDSTVPARTGTATVAITVTVPLTLTASASPVSGPAPLPVSFSSSPSGGTAPYTYDWNYGDGSAHGTTQNPSHTYTAPGGFVATLTVMDAATRVAVKTIAIGVGPALAATAIASPVSGNLPLAVSFVGLASGGTSPYAYAWAFGDGGTGTGATPTHTYTAAGPYTATLTVTDSTSPVRTTTATVAITVTVLPPVVTALKKGIPFKITVTGSNLQNGIQVYINGTLWTSVQYVSTTQIKITGGSSLKAVVPKGVPTQFRFVNPDGGQTTLTWQY